ncbi:hypothetical protein DB30_00060 [Enhygromyxa salina]|uniref:JmjC domain-containing protein n=1 Tax=Enhygromyxa salina TaxID=215803 RepID=A0A0C2D907_9BACT|nr:hypothetical protein [Enhygromyxa salina]KIG19551.1 hypothetical protein DB30_00060 [Enhygromyxa salina]
MTRRNDLASSLARVSDQLRALYEDGSPAVLRGVGPLFETAEVFEWIKRVHPRERAGTSQQKIHALKRSWGLDVEELPSYGAPDPGRPAEIYRAGAMLLEPAPFLPTPDHEFAQWVEDAHAALGGEFGMQAPGLECASFDALERLQTLLGPVLALTGPRSYRYNAFVGDYPMTPFGFHVDPHQEAVFQYVVHGQRTAMFWEGLTLTSEDARWVEDANSLATPRQPPQLRFELEPGDIVFWPGTHVHGFAPVGPSMALSMVIDRASPRTRDEVIAALEVESMAGRAALPLPDEHAFVARDASLQRRVGARIVYERWEDHLIIGVCGRTFQWPDRTSIPAAVGLFERVNATERVSVSEVIGSCADQSLLESDVLEVLTMLVSLGCLRP